MMDQEVVETLAQSLYEEAHPLGEGWEDLCGPAGQVVKTVWRDAARNQIEEMMVDPGGEE